MRYTLLIIFTIAIFCIGSYLGVNNQTGLTEKKSTFQVKNIESDIIDRKNSEAEIYIKSSFSEEETALTEQNAPEIFGESSLEKIVEQNSTFELAFFLSMLIFTAFLVALQFYSYNGKARRFQQFEKNLSEGRKIIKGRLVIQSCEL